MTLNKRRNKTWKNPSHLCFPFLNF